MCNFNHRSIEQGQTAESCTYRKCLIQHHMAPFIVSCKFQSPRHRYHNLIWCKVQLEPWDSWETRHQVKRCFVKVGNSLKWSTTGSAWKTFPTPWPTKCRTTPNLNLSAWSLQRLSVVRTVVVSLKSWKKTCQWINDISLKKE